MEYNSCARVNTKGQHALEQYGMYACSHTKPNLSVWNCTRECDASTVWAIKKLTFYAIRWLWVRVCCAYGYGRAIHRYECRHRIGPFVPSKMAVYACSCLAIWFKTFAGSGMNVDCTESRNLPLRLSWLNNGVDGYGSTTTVSTTGTGTGELWPWIWACVWAQTLTYMRYTIRGNIKQ